MFGKDFQRKYALTDQGIKNTKQGTIFTVIVNLVVMGGMGILYFLMTKFMDTLTTGAPLPHALVFILLALAFVILSLITHMQQYRTTYGLVYSEVKAVRISIAERLRKLPLGYFGKRDLADVKVSEFLFFASDISVGFEIIQLSLNLQYESSFEDDPVEIALQMSDGNIPLEAYKRAWNDAEGACNQIWCYGGGSISLYQRRPHTSFFSSR